MTMHCSARAVGHAGAGGTHQEAGSITPARVTAIRAAHRLLKGSVGRHCDAITPAIGTSKAAPPPLTWQPALQKRLSVKRSYGRWD